MLSSVDQHSLSFARCLNYRPLEAVLEIEEAVLAHPVVTISCCVAYVQVFGTFGECVTTKLAVVMFPTIPILSVLLSRQ
jgi:hypothetical protein